MTSELTTFIDIDATPERVWQVLTDLSAYPQWNPFVTRAEGAVVEGGELSLSLPPVNALLRVTLRATLLEVIPCQRLRLRTRMDRLGIPGLFEAEQTMTLTPHDGGVRLWQQARFRGLLVPLATGSLNRHRSAAYNAMNAALKDRSEGRQPTRRG